MSIRKLLFCVVSGFLFLSCDDTTRFERLSSAETGIDFINSIIEKDTFNILHDEYMYNGGAVGVGDLNNDGLADLIFTANKVSTRIFLNKGDFEFSDITSRFENLTNDQWYSGVSVVDLNHDGWLDVYITSTSSKDPQKRKNRLWVNQGTDQNGIPSFIERAEAFGIAEDGYSVHAGFFDYDLDGDLDLYVLNNIVSKNIPTNYRPKIIDGSAINNDRLYQNQGNGTFIDVTKEAGIVYEGYGLGLAFGDINKDGYPDIYVSNDYISNDILYINQRNGTFRNVSSEYLSYQSKFSMGNDISDVNNDGNLDIFTTDMMPEAYFRKKQTINGHSYFFYQNDEKFGYQHQYVRNMLHLHNGFRNGEMLPFSEVGQISGVYQTEWSWSPLFADYDNDGDKDLTISNGFPKDLTDKDFTNYKAQVYGYVADDKHMIDRIPIVKVPNYVFENTGDYGFKDQTKNWGMKIPSFSNGAAFVDLDNDGDLDYVTNNINDEAFIYRNNTIGKLKEKKNYLKIRLNGKGQNLHAIGSKVEVWNKGKLQYHEHFLSRGYISSVDPVIHFGLADSQSIDSVIVTWPNGKSRSRLTNVSTNQMLSVKEADAKPFHQKTQFNNYLFQEQGDLISYKHSEADYIDFFQNQRVLQHKLSQISPCLAKGDIDMDGVEDLIVGASNRSLTSVFLFKDGTFVDTKIEGLTSFKQCNESDIVILDIDGDKDNDVVAVSGGYATEDESKYKHYVYLNSKNLFTQSKLPVPSFPASVVRPFDFNKDGFADLFIGARVKRGNFPYSHSSYLLINSEGSFSESSVLNFDLGMVTDAVWSDYDGDGWTDIIATREWGSVVILRNRNGKTFEVFNPANLASKKGFWSAITAGDLDGDGDDDYVIGNLGENHRFTVGDKTPMGLYAVDLDKNGTIDPISTAYWKDAKGEMQEYPVNYLDELAAQSPFFRKKFTSYTKFSYTAVDSIIDRNLVTNDNYFSVNTTSTGILWNDEGNLTWQRLPAIAQIAPVKKILIHDFNGDNHPDILIAGNDHSYDVSTGFYDANKGTVLLGNGTSTFEICPHSKSGLSLQGQVTSLLYYEPVKLLVAGINRDSLVTYQVNIKGL